jgi:hypothetical protein
MSTENIGTKAYEEKIHGQLQQAKAQLHDLESRAKGKAAQAEIDAVNHLKTRHQELDKKRQDLKTASDAKVEHMKADLDAGVAKLKSSLAELSTKLKAEPRTKAG